jgi:hypothetical protein
MLTSESAKTGADFEFIIRRCQVGDEMALSLVGKATFLETYADRIEANERGHVIPPRHKHRASAMRFASFLAKSLHREAPLQRR